MASCARRASTRVNALFFTKTVTKTVTTTVTTTRRIQVAQDLIAHHRGRAAVELIKVRERQTVRTCADKTVSDACEEWIAQVYQHGGETPIDRRSRRHVSRPSGGRWSDGN